MSLANRGLLIHDSLIMSVDSNLRFDEDQLCADSETGGVFTENV